MKALYAAFALAAAVAVGQAPAFAQAAFGGTSSMRNGLPATTVDSFVFEARENREAIYGDEGTYMPPFENFTPEHRIDSGIYNRTAAGLTTGHGSYLPRAWGGDEFIGPEFSQSGRENGDPNAVLPYVPLINPVEPPVPPPMTFAPQAPTLPDEFYGQKDSGLGNIDLSGFGFGIGGIGPSFLRPPASNLPRNMTKETNGRDAIGRETKTQEFSDGSKVELVKQADGQLRPVRVTYPDGSSTVYNYDANNSLYLQAGMPNGITELNAEGQVVSQYATSNYTSWTKQAGTGANTTYGTLQVTNDGAAFYKDPIAGAYMRGANGSVSPV